MRTLPTMAICAALALGATSVGAATVENGSFEDIGNGTLNGSGWNIFSGVPGWTGDPNVEIQSNSTLGSIDAQEGIRYVELDTNQDAGISQDIFFGTTGLYELSFFYSPRVNATPTATNDMLYSIALGAAPALVDGAINGAPNPDYPWGQWTEVTDRFEITTIGTYTLAFSADGGSFASGCGNCGALIDNVSIAAVPLPASVLLMLAGIGGLGAVRSRRAKA